MHLSRSIKRCVHKTGLRNVILRLFSSEFRCNRRLVKTLTREIMEAGLERISSRRDEYPEAGRKYLDLSAYLEEAVREVIALNLPDSSRLRVLDLGCGTGYFLYIVHRCGHDILGIDLDDNAMYNNVVRLLGIPRITHRIEKFKPLPDLGEPFDLITAFSICFDCHGTDHVWGISEWKYFIDDCLNHLRSGGRLFFCFNPATTHDFDFIPEEVAEMLRRIPGASLSPNKERFLLNCVKTGHSLT